MADDGVLLALGDCNTLGTKETETFAYPLALGHELGVRVLNCGHTMCTIREGLEYARRRLSAQTRYLTIQFGLVDSWITFRGAPYVLYYPDNPGRRLLRKVVKKFKKVGRQLRFHQLFGEKPMVSPDEYQAGLLTIIRWAREHSPQVRICLIATAPSLEEHRNPGIQAFNEVIQQVARASGCGFVNGYTPFVGKPELFQDHIHLKKEAHAIIAKLCLEVFRPEPRAPN